MKGKSGGRGALDQAANSGEIMGSRVKVRRELQATKVAYSHQVKGQHFVGAQCGQRSEVTGEFCG